MRRAVDSLSFQACVQPSALAVVDLQKSQRWNYRAFDLAVWRIATYLVSQGIETGDRVAALAKNRAELVMLQFACMRIGAIYVPLNWRLSPVELKSLLEYARPSLIIGDALLESFALDGTAIEAMALESEQLDPLAPSSIDRDLPALMLFTSGTSGVPKGALLSEKNITETGISFSLIARMDAQTRVLCESPMFHVMGIVTNIHPAIMRGGAIFISDGFDAKRSFARLADPELGITHYFCVPQMAQMIRREPDFDASKLGNLVAILSGGAPHPAANICQWVDDGIPIVDGFGMSEAGTVSGMPLDLELIRKKAGAVGFVHARMQYRIVDTDGENVPEGGTGELLLKGDNVISQYWERPEQTAEAFTSDGWFKTGDIVREDEDGFLWLMDRKKDMFISGGENVYPAEIEAVLAGDPMITECAVVGQADEKWGEVGHIFVVLSKVDAYSKQQILDKLYSQLARYKVPKYVTFLEKLPRNGAGKITKNVLRELP